MNKKKSSINFNKIRNILFIFIIITIFSSTFLYSQSTTSTMEEQDKENIIVAKAINTNYIFSISGIFSILIFSLYLLPYLLLFNILLFIFIFPIIFLINLFNKKIKRQLNKLDESKKST
jgi:cell division protein FtsW (lipid II flippase)